MPGARGRYRTESVALGTPIRWTFARCASADAQRAKNMAQSSNKDVLAESGPLTTDNFHLILASLLTPDASLLIIHSLPYYFVRSR
jgi:hypothetical protein